MGKNCRGGVCSLSLLAALAATAAGKAPEAPRAPTGEFKVLSAGEQEFFQAEPSSVSGYVNFAEWIPTSSVRNAALGIAGRFETVHYAPSASSEQSKALARAVFEMAETHRSAGDWEEARRWYTGLRELFPRSEYVGLAAERLQQLRVAAEPRP